MRLPTLLLATTLFVSCGTEGSAPGGGDPVDATAVAVSDLAAVQGALAPRADERGVLVQVWATW